MKMGRMTIPELEDELVRACTYRAMAEARYARAERGGGATAEDFAELREADERAADVAVELCRALYGPRASAHVSRTLGWGMGEVFDAWCGLAADTPGKADYERVVALLCDGFCMPRDAVEARIEAGAAARPLGMAMA